MTLRTLQVKDDKRNTLSAKIGNLDLLIVKSLGLVAIYFCKYIIAEIKSSTKLFGEVFIIVLGDLYQLQPVRQQFVFMPVSDHLARLHGSLLNCFGTHVYKANQNYEKEGGPQLCR
ncbi:hypothetical protein MAR_018303, partial [Mya arenaria]